MPFASFRQTLVPALANPKRAPFTLHVTVTAPTATKHVAVLKALNAFKEEPRSALDTADMISPTPGEENSDSLTFQTWVMLLNGGALELAMFRDIRGGSALELRAE